MHLNDNGSEDLTYGSVGAKNYVSPFRIQISYTMTSQNQQAFAGRFTPINKIQMVLPCARVLAFRLLLLSRRHSIKKLYELLSGYLYKHLQDCTTLL